MARQAKNISRAPEDAVSASQKPLFTQADMAELIRNTTRAVEALAKLHGISFSYVDSQMIFSVESARKLVICAVTAKSKVRFDRISMLHYLALGDPELESALQPPRYSWALEQELKRAAKLPEPARTRRMHALWEAMRDAETLARCLK